MKQRMLMTAALACLTTSAVYADFTYEQTSKVTGGAMAGMMKVAGAFSKAAREPMVSTVIVKGDRMAHISRDHIQVIDLNKETITDVDTNKKTYSVTTFAEMTQALQKLSAKMNEKSADAPEMNWKADVKQTGATKQINGFPTKQTILTLEMEGKDAKSGDKGALNVVTDMWLAPSVPGYGEVRSFYERMASKLNWTPGGMGMMNAQPGMAKGMANLYKEASKLDGMPMLQIVRMGGTVNGMTPGQAAAAQQQPSTPPPTAGEVAGDAAAGAAASRMGRIGGLAGGLGGLGGFGRKKKTEPTQQEKAQEAQVEAGAQQAANSASAGSLMEMTMEITSFTAAADASKFDVPAGFKQVESEMAKMAKKN